MDLAGTENAPAYLNGAFLPLGEVRVPVLDRGFIFGDGVYEVIPVYGRRPLRLDDHLRRLAASLQGIGLANPHDDGQWTALIGDLIGRSPFADQNLYLQVTRGVGKRDHAFPAEASPTVFLMTHELKLPARNALEQGVACITAADNRWLHCDLKTTALLPNVLLRQQAVAAGAVEAVLVRDGHLTEGAASAILAVQDGVILAPPEDHLILPSITRRVLLELARDTGLTMRVAPVAEAQLRAAEEILLASATKEILPVTRLDARPVGAGSPGPVFRRLHALYQGYKAAQAHR